MGETDTHVFRYVPASHLISYEWLIPDGGEIQERTLRYSIRFPTPVYMSFISFLSSGWCKYHQKLRNFLRVGSLIFWKWDVGQFIKPSPNIYPHSPSFHSSQVWSAIPHSHKRWGDETRNLETNTANTLCWQASENPSLTTEPRKGCALLWTLTACYQYFFWDIVFYLG